MKIAIIGGGYVGLSSAYYLSQTGHKITVFEKENVLGGLASSFKEKSWKWSLDKHYHHIFPTDQNIINLAKELNHPIYFKTPRTSLYLENKILPFNSPLDLLLLPNFPLMDKFRTGLTIVYIKLLSNWKSLENISAENFIKKYSGINSWNKIWYPLFISKFGDDYKIIPASWFWARLKKRGTYFGYPKGGFDSLTNSIKQKCLKNDVDFKLHRKVEEIKKQKEKFTVNANGETFSNFDKVICTLPTDDFSKIFPQLPSSYRKNLNKLKGRGAINLVISLKKKLLPEDTYWLNINDASFPFLGVVEHTNFINNKHYSGEHLIYIPNYLPINHPYFKLNKKQLLKKFIPYLKKLNPDFDEKSILNIWCFKSSFAQPVMTLNYSNKIPEIYTPLKNVYLVNMQQVYPWDRQTNYAIAQGQNISEIISKSTS